MLARTDKHGSGTAHKIYAAITPEEDAKMSKHCFLRLMGKPVEFPSKAYWAEHGRSMSKILERNRPSDKDDAVVEEPEEDLDFEELAGEMQQVEDDNWADVLEADAAASPQTSGPKAKPAATKNTVSKNGGAGRNRPAEGAKGNKKKESGKTATPRILQLLATGAGAPSTPTNDPDFVEIFGTGKPDEDITPEKCDKKDEHAKMGEIEKKKDKSGEMDKKEKNEKKQKDKSEKKHAKDKSEKEGKNEKKQKKAKDEQKESEEVMDVTRQQQQRFARYEHISQPGKRFKVCPAAHEMIHARLRKWQEDNNKQATERPKENTWYYHLRCDLIDEEVLSRHHSWDVCRNSCKNYVEGMKQKPSVDVD